jgi:hypothetical protein
MRLFKDAFGFRACSHPRLPGSSRLARPIPDWIFEGSRKNVRRQNALETGQPASSEDAMLKGGLK